MGRFQLNLHQVLSFYCLAKEQSFSRAAEQLGITQPAVTQHVRGLEIQFGLKLVNLNKKRVHLTKAGERFMAYAEELYNHAMVTENFLKSYQFSNISIGIASPLVFYFTTLIDELKENYSSIKISIKEGSSRPLVEDLVDYKLDICLIGLLSPYCEKLRHFRIHTDDQMVFVSSPDYHLSSDQPIKWSELNRHPLIVQSEGSAARAMILDQFKKRDLTPIIGAEVNNIELVKELTRQKKGVALMFEPNVRQEVARGELKVIQVENCELKMGAIDVLVNREERLPLSVECFLTLIKERYKDNFEEIAAS